MTKFIIGRLPGQQSRAVRPNEIPTLAQLKAAVSASRLTTDEARHLAVHVLVCSRRWQEPPSPDSKLYYRKVNDPADSEQEVLEGPS